MGTGVTSRAQNVWVLKLTTHLFPVPRLRMSGAIIPPTPIITSWHGCEQSYRFVIFSVDQNTENQLLGLIGYKGLQRMSISMVVPDREVLYVWCASE
jgi:hypothetical protein